MRATDEPPSAGDWTLWGSELSPFALKVEALLRFAGVPYRWLPASGGFRAALRFQRRVHAVRRRRRALTWPEMDPLDELPLVPFLFGPSGETLYDSSAIGEWLARGHGGASARATSLVPPGAGALAFAVRLADEALDEVGLYVVHHNRWVVSARDNDAGRRLGREMRPLLGPLAALVARAFPARQVRRLPYLFSVAREGERSFDEICAGLLAALEPVLAVRPFLFGERFTLADASVYGQLGMNRLDPSARALIARAAPATQAWVERLARGDFAGHRDGAPLVLDATLAPLLSWTCRTFVPLMRQNHAAWEGHRDAGETLFNEAAFDAGRALYDGSLLGRPFTSVAKTFQVRVWRDLRRAWDALGPPSRARLEEVLPAAHGIAAGDNN